MAAAAAAQAAALAAAQAAQAAQAAAPPPVTPTLGAEAAQAATWVVAELAKYPHWCCFADVDGEKKCPKKCCRRAGDTGPFDHDQRPKNHDFAAAAAQLKQQRAPLRVNKLFANLKSYSTVEAATVSEWLGVKLDHPLVYETMTYAQAILVRYAFRWFAGYTQDQLETLRTTRAVHPDILPRVLPNTTDFCVHDINMQHMKGHTVKWQKFVFLAAAGEIVYKLNKSDHDQVSTQAIRCWL